MPVAVTVVIVAVFDRGKLSSFVPRASGVIEVSTGVTADTDVFYVVCMVRALLFCLVCCAVVYGGVVFGV